jgi:hypothetical protein
MPEGFKLESGGLRKFLVGPFYLFEESCWRFGAGHCVCSVVAD